jgi:hypothetical protein
VQGILQKASSANRHQGEMFFKGGWPRFAEDYDLHQGWFLLFDGDMYFVCLFLRGCDVYSASGLIKGTSCLPFSMLNNGVS